MVLLHVKRSEKESFLYETPAATDVEVVLRELVTIRLAVLSGSVGIRNQQDCCVSAAVGCVTGCR